MKKSNLFLCTFLAMSVLLLQPAYAYLDPGTGSMLLQILAASALFIGVAWRQILNLFKKLFGKAKNAETISDAEDDDE